MKQSFNKIYSVPRHPHRQLHSKAKNTDATRKMDGFHGKITATTCHRKMSIRTGMIPGWPASRWAVKLYR